MRRNRDLHTAVLTARASAEQYSLFRNYIDHRHEGGGMADMTVLDYSAMVDESFVDTRNYRVPRERGDRWLVPTSAAGASWWRRR